MTSLTENENNDVRVSESGDAASLAAMIVEIDALRARLADSVETLRAIRHGEVDVLLVGGASERLFILESTDKPYRTFVENMTDGAATVSEDGTVLYANEALARMTGSTCPRIVGQSVFRIFETIDPLADLFGFSGRGTSAEAVLINHAGPPVPVLIGASTLDVDGSRVSCLTFTDLTGKILAEAAVAHSEQHDALTGLPNRGLLMARIEHGLRHRAPSSGLTALYFIDVDGFKNINDAHGHHIGDEVLRTISDRLRIAVRPRDTVARIGGDEFVVLCEEIADLDDATFLAARMRDAVGSPMKHDPQVLEITVSIGVAVASESEDATPETLLRDSDEAMYKAKRQGPNNIELFDEALRGDALRRLELLADLRHAAQDEEMRLVYQPVLNLGTETITGVEALVRWQHPTRGLVFPDAFIPFAERSGLIQGIGDWVMSEACRQAADWASRGRLLTMAVNISGRQLSQGAGLVASVEAALDTSGINPASLILEVTESALMDDAESALNVVNSLKALGVKMAIDDFGTGYSSLVYLQRFPMDQLKIDRSFVSEVAESAGDRAIVKSIIELARAFDIDAVAEGIENYHQLAVLQGFGCSMGQGYLWSPGTAPDEVEGMLA